MADIMGLPAELVGGFDQCKAVADTVLDAALRCYRDQIAAGATKDRAAAQVIRELIDVVECHGIDSSGLIVMLGIAVARLGRDG